IGVDPSGLDERIGKLLPAYMTMGQQGMSGMTEMGMKVPPNSVPMVGGIGPHDEITMGGMFTIFKVREQLSSYDQDPGWYAGPPGTQADLAPPALLQHHAIAEDGSTAPRAPADAMKSWHQAKPMQMDEAPARPATTPPGSADGAHR